MSPLQKKTSLKLLKGSAKGQDVFVLGGGVHLLYDLEIAQEKIDKTKRPVVIAINDHAFHIDDPVRPDFMVFCDTPDIHPDIDKYQKEMIGKRVSIIEEFSDYDFEGVRKWYDGNSATLAIWLACYLGGDKIILCGFDLYQGERSYFHGKRENEKETSKALEDHLIPFNNCLAACPGSERIRAVSGPLVELFGSYVSN